MKVSLELGELGPALVVDAGGNVEHANAGGEPWRGHERRAVESPGAGPWWVERRDASGVVVHALMTSHPRPDGGALVLFGELRDAVGARTEWERGVLDSLPAMLGYWDAALRNRFANRAYRDWFGMTPEEIHGRHIRELLGPEIYAKNLPYIEGALRGEPQAFERAIPRPGGGSVRHSSAIYVPDVIGGEVRGFAVLVFDVTELKTTQAELQAAREELEHRVAERTRELEVANAELKRSNTELGQFAYVASHDLQEPLRTLATYCELLDERYRDTLDERGRRYLGYAVTAARRMQALVAAVLEVSRVEGVAAPHTPCDASAAALAAIEALREQISQTGAQITVEPLPRVIGDPQSITKVFQNLFSNAMKFAGAEPPRVTVRGAQIGAMIEISVTDDGIGIDMQFADKMFGMFQRVHTGAYEGSGIGLAIVKKIVERCGGAVGVRSRLGHGATVWFTLRSGDA